ncbi:universal stress protein [Domibacillus antri]|uniref:Universal stress protein n=1 Tax=Domibacillus antri TaxID=1714264 RepID=A0A1Q8Q6N8_9BACI|nr:universal stress protein [Domibacillus antri]OLN23004.1 universal stress protein [Domibacillus antri]
MYKRILLAADGSENALRAAKEAVKVASLSENGEVTIVFVADFSKSKSEILHSKGTEELQLARRKKLLSVEEELKSNGIPYTVHILHGEPGPTIVEYANEQEYDLVIIGSRGLNALQEMVLGSVSHKVVKRVNGPVMIVK